MTKTLARKIDAYCKKHMPWWDYEECSVKDSPKVVYEGLCDYFGNDFDDELCSALRKEAYKEALKANQTFFDEADAGYCPDGIVDGWGDVYLCKGWKAKELLDDFACCLDDNRYYLVDCCTMDGIPFFCEVRRRKAC